MEANRVNVIEDAFEKFNVEYEDNPVKPMKPTRQNKSKITPRPSSFSGPKPKAERKFGGPEQQIPRQSQPSTRLSTPLPPLSASTIYSRPRNTNSTKSLTSVYKSSSNLHRVNSTGKFNYELGRTGFLAEAKMRARRFSQNPKKYLDMIADSQDELGIAPTEIPKLESFVQNLAQNDRYSSKETEIRRKAKLAKDRGFLLSMATKPNLNNRPAMNKFMNSFANGTDPYADSELTQMDALIEQYLLEIKCIDINDIEDWLIEYVDMNELELPIGLPPNLKLPRTFEDENKLTREFIESTKDNFVLLDMQYHSKIEQVSNVMKKNHESIFGNGWSIKDTCLLYYVANYTDCGAGSSVAKMLPLEIELTSRLFPSKSRREVIQQKYFLKAKKVLEEKRANTLQAWLRDKTEMETKANLAWQEITIRKIAHMENKISLKKQRDICDFWNERLDKMRKEKCKEVRKIQFMVEPIQQIRNELIKSIAEKEIRRRNVIKNQVHEFKIKKSEDLEEERRGKEIMTEMMAEMLKKKFAYNKTRTQLRREEWSEKEKTRQELAEEAEKARQKRIRALEKTKEPVEIDYKPENVIMDTKASYARRLSTLDHGDPEEQALVKFFREAYSFSTDTILKDRRVKFESKLRKAGLLDSNYAMSILRAMDPKPKPHLESNIKLDHDG